MIAPPPFRLDADPDAINEVRTALDQLGYDAAQQWFRPDYFISPFPHHEAFTTALGRMPTSLATVLRLFSLAGPVALDKAERDLGRGVIEASLATGLLAVNADGDVTTSGFSVISRLGCYAVVSTNPYYPGFRPDNADIYAGPDTYALAAHLDRLAATLPRTGQAVDLCCGSGIIGQGLATRLPGLTWTGVDLSPAAVNVAGFNALLNGLGNRYSAALGDLYQPLAGGRVDVIVCNPPFIPVPAGHTFPGYGAGGEDGLAVIRPLLDGLGRHLADEGRAVIYAEGIATTDGPAVRQVMEEIARRDGLDIELLIVAAATREQALYAIGRLLAAQTPSRLPEVAVWAESFARQGVTSYVKYLTVVHPGRAALRISSLVS